MSSTVISADSIVELAKNMVNPMKCDWAAGTRTECNVLLGSWTLLRKHLHTQHCHATKLGFVCYLPKCNHQLHPNRLAFAEHIDSAHLTRLMFPCPLTGCDSPPLKGTETLINHYQEKHGDMDGQVLGFPVDFATWEPFSWTRSLAGGLMAGRSIADSSLPPSLPLEMKNAYGRILVNVMMQHPLQETLNLGAMTLEETPKKRGPPESPQKSSQVLSPASHSTTRRRTRTKQLEKLDEKDRTKREAEEDGVPEVVLDDLTKFAPEDDPSRGHHCGDGRRGGDRRRPLVLRGRRSQSQAVTDVMLKRVNLNVIFGQRSRMLLADLSRPEPMSMYEEVKGTEDDAGGGGSKIQKSILYETLVKKVEQMERTGIVDLSLMQ